MVDSDENWPAESWYARCKFFSEIFVDEDTSIVPTLLCRHDAYGSPICNIEFFNENVYTKLSSLNPCKQPGPDGF